LVIGELPSCRADPTLLKQALLNLLSNALKFTRRRERARIEIGCARAADLPSPAPEAVRPDTPVYFVRDNGAGFDMRYAGKLFGVFQRLHTQAEFQGSGVGLAIVQRAIQRHGGRIWAEAKVDGGATFCFTVEGEN
jgi:light-regulated signal transduction histidine kinase (bacteriophytochrome)